MDYMNYSDIYNHDNIGKYILFFVFMIMIIYGINSGDIFEIWKNGATL